MRTACPRLGIRIPAARLAAGLVFLCLAAVPRAEAQSRARHVASGPLRLWGTVSDQITDEPVAGARLHLVHLGSGVKVAAVETNGTGSFAFLSLAAGSYEFRVDRLGYEGVVDTVGMADGTDRLADVALVPAALSLTPVVVDVARRRASSMLEFERRRTLGIGSFVTRDEIEDRHPLLITDMLRTVSGVRVVPDARGDARLLLRGRCEPRFYVDGLPVYGGVSLDLTLRPDDVEAIEVHSTASAPVKYARNACGVVLVWTRVPERTDGGGSWWKGLVVAGGLLGVMAITR